MPCSRSSTMNDFWRKLLYRWFVQYNPLYLVSAMLVLGGTILTSRGLATEGSLYGPLGVAAIAEIYALALIGGAALLTRIGQRRPAVMLALLTALYQCDLTLHTETCVQLGVAGTCAAAAWLALFGLKIFALGWAMKVRISFGAFATAMLGAVLLTMGPYLVEQAGAPVSGAFLATTLFALGVVFPKAQVTSQTELDAWGQTVLRRSLGTIWGLWGFLLTLHVLFWASNHAVPLGVVVPVATLLLARRSASEAVAWSIVGVTLVLVALAAPEMFALFAFLAAATLALRAYGHFWTTIERTQPDAPGPYRMGNDDHGGMRRFEYIEVPLTAAARARHLVGALACLYLSLWTMSWHGGALPSHSVFVDAGIVVLAIGLALHLKRWTTLSVPALVGLHAFVRSGAIDVIPRPHSTLGWGSSALALGFALLLAGLLTSYRLRKLTLPTEP
jgi:hypothetical protein